MSWRLPVTIVVEVEDGFEPTEQDVQGATDLAHDVGEELSAELRSYIGPGWSARVI